MKISLIIPTAYTPEPYFSRCMQRVKEETQYKDFEVIISEDGNVTDEMRTHYPEWAIVIKHPEASGCGLARKRAQEICTGDVVCFLDSDDLISRGYYELIKDAWEKYPDASCIEFGFNNVNPNGCYETYFCDEAQTYGHFSYEMVWNKTYKGEYVRNATSLYNPPLMMTPAEDLLWNTVYQSMYNKPYEHERKILLDRYIRTTGLAWSTATDITNRIKMMEYSMEVAKGISTSAPIYMWILTYIEDLKNHLKKGTVNCAGYKWCSSNVIPVSKESPILFNVSNGNADKLLDAIKKWDKLYGLPHFITLNNVLDKKEEMIKVFESFSDNVFIIECEDNDLTKEWLDAFDNVVFKVYSTDGKVDVSLLENDKVYEYYCNNAEALCKKYPKVRSISNENVDVELCKKVEGVWTIDVTSDEFWVYPCNGNNGGCKGTIEKRPYKCDVTTCSKCTNPNYVEVC